MKPPRAEELHTIISQGRWVQAVAILSRLDPTVAADALLSLPYEGQQDLFRRLPPEFAAKLAPIFPYYHTFVLLHSLPLDAMTAVVEKMNPLERSTFLDELPEEAWQQIVNELSERPPAQTVAAEGREPALEEAGVERVVAPPQPIIEARQVAKAFNRPDGGEIQVIAPISMTVEPDVIIALLGPSGSGKSTLLRMISGAPPTPETSPCCSAQRWSLAPWWSPSTAFSGDGFTPWLARNSDWNLPKRESQGTSNPLFSRPGTHSNRLILLLHYVVTQFAV